MVRNGGRDRRERTVPGEESGGADLSSDYTRSFLGKKITAAKARAVRVPPKRHGVRRVNVASWRLGALLLSTLTPLNWEVVVPSLSRCCWAEINGGFVSLSRSVCPRPRLGVERKGEEW